MQKRASGDRFINWIATPWGERLFSIFIYALGLILIGLIILLSVLIYIFLDRGQITDAITTAGDLAITIFLFALYLKITR